MTAIELDPIIERLCVSSQRVRQDAEEARISNRIPQLVVYSGLCIFLHGNRLSRKLVFHSCAYIFFYFLELSRNSRNAENSLNKSNKGERSETSQTFSRRIRRVVAPFFCRVCSSNFRRFFTKGICSRSKQNFVPLVHEASATF